MQITEIKNLVHDTVDTNPTTFPDVRMVRGMNKAQDIIVNLIIENDKVEHFDDDNWGDLSEGTLNLVSGQRDYILREDENFAELLFVKKISILNKDNEWVTLERSTDIKQTETGIPTKFYMNGSTVLFDKTPDYNAANGIYVSFARKPKPITVNDTTRELGIPSTFHHLVALMTAYDYARAKVLSNRNDILREVEIEQQRLGVFVKDKNQNAVSRIIPNIENTR